MAVYKNKNGTWYVSVRYTNWKGEADRKVMLLIETIDSEQTTPSLSQAQRMKRLSQEGKLNDDTMLGIVMEQKKPENWDLKLPMDKIRKFFPRSYTPQRMEETIMKLLEVWMKKRQRDQQR